MTGKYIYGVNEFNEGLRFSTLLDSTGENGVARAHTIAYRDISAVVGDAEIVEYTAPG